MNQGETVVDSNSQHVPLKNYNDHDVLENHIEAHEDEDNNITITETHEDSNLNISRMRIIYTLWPFPLTLCSKGIGRHESRESSKLDKPTQNYKMT